jgi:arginine decarboxylase
VDEVLSNLTCDSDSKVSEFISRRHSLSLHELPTHATHGYYLGMFLGGSADTYHIIYGQ